MVMAAPSAASIMPSMSTIKYTQTLHDSNLAPAHQCSVSSLSLLALVFCLTTTATMACFRSLTSMMVPSITSDASAPFTPVATCPQQQEGRHSVAAVTVPLFCMCSALGPGSLLLLLRGITKPCSAQPLPRPHPAWACRWGAAVAAFREMSAAGCRGALHCVRT